MKKDKEMILVLIFSIWGMVIGALFGLAATIYRLITNPDYILTRPLVLIITCILSILFILLNYYLLKKKNWARILLLIINAILGLFPIFVFLSHLASGVSLQEIITMMSKGFKPLFVLYFLYFYSYIVVFNIPSIKKKFK